jgi:hypothetical protein
MSGNHESSQNLKSTLYDVSLVMSLSNNWHLFVVVTVVSPLCLPFFLLKLKTVVYDSAVGSHMCPM